MRLSARLTSASLSTLLCASLLIAPSASAAPAIPQKLVTKMRALQPGTSAADVRQQVHEIAKKAEVSPKRAARELLDLLLEEQGLRHDQVSSEGIVAATAAASSGTGLVRINVPRARQAGDIVYAPNKHGKSKVPTGHAALFTTKRRIIHAPGTGQVVQTAHVSSKKAKVFAPKAQMMEVRIDKGKGRVLSEKKRKIAIKWAKGRTGDRYRGIEKKNTVVVSGKVGSKDAAQNCSQLVWAAYKKANGYDFNPVSKLKLVSPAAYYADKRVVTPKELMQAPQTVTYKTVTK